MANQQEPTGDVKINRGKVGSISLYEITADELDLLERGSPSSTYFNFAVSLISVSISFFISIFSTEISDQKTYNVFWIVALVTLILGVVLLVVWWKTNVSVASIFIRIRKRMTDPPAAENCEAEPPK